MDDATRLTLAMNAAHASVRDAERAASEAAARFEFAQREAARGGHRYSVVRAVRAASSTSGLTRGIESELSKDIAHCAGLPYDIHKPLLPWWALGDATRVLQFGTSTLGGYFVGTAPTPAAEALFPVSVAVQLGVQVLDNLNTTMVIPRVGTAASATWTGETGTATASQPVLAAPTLNPHQVGGYLELSRQLLKQSPEFADRLVSGHLLRVVGAALDAAVLAGTGTDQPVGIVQTSGIGTKSAASFTHTISADIKETVSTAKADDARIAWVARPAVRELLEVRERASGSGFIWDNDRVLSRPAYVSMSMPASTILCGDFTQSWLLLWHGALQVEVNPYANFPAGIVGMRVLANANVAVTAPSAFCVGTSLS